MIDLSHWKLTIPSGKDIPASDLVAGYQLPGAFTTDPKSGAITFRVPNIGGTTSNSHYSRCELREMRAPGGDASAPANNWTTQDGGTMHARLRVDHVSTTGDADQVGRVVVGQIHGPDTEVVRLYYRKLPKDKTGRIYAGYDSIKDVTTWSPDIVSNKNGAGIALGEQFTYNIKLTGRVLAVHVHDAGGLVFRGGHTIDVGYAGLPLYFKAGCYNQCNTGELGDFSQTTFSHLQATHP